MIVFGASRLFSSQLPINWALQTGNGNTDIERHSPKPSSNSSQIPDPPKFSLPTTFKKSIFVKSTFLGPFLDHRGRARDFRAELLLQRDDRLPVLGHGRHHHHQQDIHRQDLRQGEPQQLRRRRQGMCTAKENSNYVFPDIKQRGLVLSFHSHISVNDLNIPRIGPPILLQPNTVGRPIVGIYLNRSQI